MEESREERRELEEGFLALRLSDSLINLSCVCCFLPIQWKWIDISHVCCELSFLLHWQKQRCCYTNHWWKYLLGFIYLFIFWQSKTHQLYGISAKHRAFSPLVFCFKVLLQNISVLRFFFKIITKKRHNHVSLWKTVRQLSAGLTASPCGVHRKIYKHTLLGNYCNISLIFLKYFEILCYILSQVKGQYLHVYGTVKYFY